MTAASKRVTLRLHLPVVKALDELVAGGWAPSRNALVERLVEEAVRRHRRRQREEAMYREYVEAFSDPAYREEQERILREFARADAEAMGAEH